MLRMLIASFPLPYSGEFSPKRALISSNKLGNMFQIH